MTHPMFEKHKAALEDIAEASEYGHIVRPSKKLERAEFPKAEVRTPLLLSCDAADEKGCMDARFGPTSLVFKEHDALTVGLYSTKQDVIDAMTDATLRSGVPLSIKLTGGVFVNQSSADSDYHGSDANHCRVIQRRYHARADAPRNS